MCGYIFFYWGLQRLSRFFHYYNNGHGCGIVTFYFSYKQQSQNKQFKQNCISVHFYMRSSSVFISIMCSSALATARSAFALLTAFLTSSARPLSSFISQQQLLALTLKANRSQTLRLDILDL